MGCLLSARVDMISSARRPILAHMDSPPRTALGRAGPTGRSDRIGCLIPSCMDEQPRLHGWWRAEGFHRAFHFRVMPLSPLRPYARSRASARLERHDSLHEKEKCGEHHRYHRRITRRRKEKPRTAVRGCGGAGRLGLLAFLERSSLTTAGRFHLDLQSLTDPGLPASVTPTLPRCRTRSRADGRSG